MSTYVVIRKGFDHCKHFDAETAAKAIANIRYTDKSGVNHDGAHWTLKEVCDITAAMKFAPCVTDEDKWVAFNATFADLCKVLTLEQIVAAAHAFWFADAPCDKIFRYIKAMK